MASAVITVREAPAPAARALGFVPPAIRAANPAKLSHLDPRPLWSEPAVASPWKSPSFWAAWAICAPVVGVVRALRG